MADYGGYGIKFWPFAKENPEPAGAMPNYGEPITIGELNQVSDTITYNEASSYGDDVRARYLRQLREYGLTVQVLDISNENMSVLLGAKLDTEGTLRIGSNDNAPYGAVTFTRRVLLKDNVMKLKGMIYTKVKASMEGRTYTTKGDSITLTGQGITFGGSPCNSGDAILISPDFETEAEVEAWFEEKLGGAA